MRRIAIGLVFLLAACTEKTEQQALPATWVEHRSLGTRQHEWPTIVELEQVRWIPAEAARGLHGASALSIPEIPAPPAINAAKLDRYVPAEKRSLSADAQRLRTLEELSTQLGQLQFVEDNRLTKSAPVAFPATWVQ